jgi:T5SS/PEP-CTERM-associated repeat protein
MAEHGRNSSARGGHILAAVKRSVGFSIALAAFALPAPFAMAATVTWTGANGGNWTTGTNWSTSSAPGSADTAVVNSGAADGPIISSSAGTVTNTEIGTTATNGIFSIQAGGSLTDANGYLGLNAGSIGTATVSGTGATWTNTGSLFVGNSGDGMLTISNGATVTSVAVRIGEFTGSIGTVTITGAGSTWSTGSGNLEVGQSGNGLLTIGTGATVSAVTGYIAAFAGSIGTAVVSGTGAVWTNSASLYVGNSYGGAGGIGYLTISNGGAVSDVNAYIAGTGGTSIGTGTVTVTDGAWTNTGTIEVGYFGFGSLTIGTGGTVSDANGIIGVNTISIGTAVVSGTGATWTNNGYLYVGYGSQGMLTIGTGGTVTDQIGAIGWVTGGIGTATVSGTDATWTNSGNFIVGANGYGMLTIGTGGTVSDMTGYIAAATGSIGTAVVSGTGAAWTNSGGMKVGQYGTGTLTIQNGGLVAIGTGGSGDLNDGTYAGVSGTVNVTADGTMTIGGNTHIGEYGYGALNISSGGVVDSVGSYVGDLAGSIGTAIVTGSGALWQNSGNLNIGYSGTGSLTIANGGTVTTGSGVTYTNNSITTTSSSTVYIAANAGSIGTLNIGASPGSAPVAPGTLVANTVAFGSGTGTINFNYSGSSYVFSPAITGNGTINNYTGNTFLSGTGSAFTGTVNVTPGTNVTTGGQQQAATQTLISQQQAALIQDRSLTNSMLGFTRPVDNSSYAYAGAMFGSAEGMAGGQYSSHDFTILGGVGYGQMDNPGVSQADASTIAAALRYTMDDPFDDDANQWHPYGEVGGSTTLGQSLTFSRSYGLNGNQSITGSGSTYGTAWNEYGRLGMVWDIDSDDQLTAYGEYGQQNLKYSAYTEQNTPFAATVAGGVMRMQVARLGTSYTVDLRDILYVPFSVTLAGAAAHAVNAQSHMTATIDGVLIPTANADPTWGEFGARFNVDLTDQITASLGIDGTSGASNLGTAVHGDVGLGYRF